MKNQNDRRLIAYTLRKQGLQFKDIGKHLNVTASRASQLFLEREKELKWQQHWMYGLPSRACNVLCRLNITNKNEVLKAYKSGLLKPGRLGPRNYSYRTHEEVARWLGLTDEIEKEMEKPNATLDT